MTKFIAPLGVFLGGQLLLLVAFLFFPALDATGQQLAADTSSMASTFWGWSWAPSLLKFIVFFAIEAGVLWATAEAFIAARD